MSVGSQLASGYSKLFWDGLAEGRLRLLRCSACGHHQDFPQARCRHCLSADMTWVDAQGKGVLHTFSTVHRPPSPEFAAQSPYTVGLVRLPEGVQLMGRILVDNEERLTLDMPVRAKPIPGPLGGYILGFEPA